MSNRKRVTPTWKELKEDLETMTFWEKVDHLWTYYKIYVFIILIAGLLGVGMITAAVNISKETVVLGLMVNVSMSPEGKDYLESGYADKVGAKKNQQVLLHSTNNEDWGNPLSHTDTSEATSLLIARVSAGQLDYALLDHFAMDHYVEQEVFLDLRECFSEEELAELAEKDLLVYGTTGETDEEDNLILESADMENRVPYGVKLNDTAFCRDALYGEEIIFTVSGNNPDLDQVRGIWEHIHDWENRKTVYTEGRDKIK